LSYYIFHQHSEQIIEMLHYNLRPVADWAVAREKSRSTFPYENVSGSTPVSLLSLVAAVVIFQLQLQFQLQLFEHQ